MKCKAQIPRRFVITYYFKEAYHEMEIEANSRYDAKKQFKFRHPGYIYVSCREAEGAKDEQMQ
ncbi:MAG: hypothetical protein IJE25_08235 [Clostridia bacterium]|nr:hypothetical protein [Clostridia bacterium]